jgi:hypothetical protein
MSSAILLLVKIHVLCVHGACFGLLFCFCIPQKSHYAYPSFHTVAHIKGQFMILLKVGVSWVSGFSVPCWDHLSSPGVLITHWFGFAERSLRRSPRIKSLSFSRTNSSSFYSVSQPKSRSVQRVHSFQQDKSGNTGHLIHRTMLAWWEVFLGKEACNVTFSYWRSRIGTDRQGSGG